MGSSDVTVGHETCLEEAKDEPAGTEVENLSVDSASSEEVAMTQNNQNFDCKLETIVIPCNITCSDLQHAKRVIMFHFVSRNFSLMVFF